MLISDEYEQNFIFENLLFDQNISDGNVGCIVQISHTVSINESTKTKVAIPEIKYVEFTSNKYIGSQTNEGGIIYNDIVELQDDAMRLKVTECIFKYNYIYY